MFLIWFFVLFGAAKVNANFNNSYQNVDVSICIRNILSRITETNTITADVALIDIDDVVIQNLQGVKGARYMTKSQSWINNEIYNTIYVMNFMDFIGMKKGFENTMKDKYWNPTSNFIIIINNTDDKLDKITGYLVFNNIYNVSLLIKEANDYTIYTFHSPIHPCNHRKYLVRITQCSALDDESYIFPKIDARDLRGCHFKLVAHNFYPMINMDNNKSEGLEQRIIQTFSERHNMVIELTKYFKIDKLGKIVENYTYVDIPIMVRAGKVEGAIGGYFVSTAFLGKFSFGYPVVIDRMVVIMPNAKLYDTWHAVFQKAFYVIMCIFCLIITFSVLAYLLALFPSREADPIRDFMIVFGFFLNTLSVREMKRGVSETLILSSLLFSVFILPYSIQAFLYSVKTHPIKGFEPKIYQDINEKYHLIVPEDWAKSSTKNLINIGCKNRIECLNEVMYCKDRMHYTIISETLFDAYHWMLIDERCTSDVYKLRDPVYIMLRTVHFRLGSVIVKPYDKFILNFASSGLLMKHWYDTIYNERLKCKYHAKPAHYALTCKDLQQAFAILIGGFCLSAISFVYEILAKKK